MNLLLLNRNLILVVVECQMISIRFSCLNLHNITTHAYFAIPKFRMIFSTTSFTFRSNQIFRTLFYKYFENWNQMSNPNHLFYHYHVICVQNTLSRPCQSLSVVHRMVQIGQYEVVFLFYFYFLFIQMSPSNLAVFSKQFWCKSLWIYLFIVKLRNISHPIFSLKA
jgi:hypothetical protein